MKKLKFLFYFLMILLCFSVVYYTIYTFAEPKAYDFLTRSINDSGIKSKNNLAHDDVVLVVIDTETNMRYRWPWKRELFCPIFEYFHEYAKPKAVVFDSFVLTLDNENPNSDKKFFSTLSKFDNLISGFMPMETRWSNKEFGEKYEKIFAQKYALNLDYRGRDVEDIFRSIAPFAEPYFDAIKYVGNVMSIPGAIDGTTSYWIQDEVYRTYNYISKYKDVFYPSIALKTLLVLNNNPRVVVTNNCIEIPELNYKIPQNTNSIMSFTPLKFYKIRQEGQYSHIKYSAVDIMDSYNNIQAGKKPVINPEEFKDKIVVIGANVMAATGLNDTTNSPMLTNHPGVDIQATAIDNLMHNDFLLVIPQWINIIIAVIGMLIVYLAIKKYNILRAVICILLTVLIYSILTILCFQNSVILNFITPNTMFIMMTVVAYTHKYFIENKNKEKVQLAMGKYMSEDVMKSVLQNIDNLGLGGKKSVATILFSDIRGFTSLSENMSAQEVSEILNEYFSEMEPIVTKYNGIINKFIGDAIMAVFGEPINDENHPLNAVKCGYEMLMKVQELHKKWEDEGKPLIEIGVGINTGEVFVGNIGSEKRMEYTVIGDTVNLASRLESYNKTYRTKMLISSSTYEYAKKSLYVVKIPDVEIRGKTKKLDIYEVLKVV